MKKRLVWLPAICIASAVSFLPGCAPSATKTTLPATTTPPAATTASSAPATTQAATDKPRYGGKLALALSADINSFDAINSNIPDVIELTNEELWTGDWTRGPAGTGEVAWDITGGDVWEYKAGALADRWEISAPDYATFYIRKGVRFALDTKSEASRLVAGRELTANDVAYTLTRVIASPNARLGQQPELKDVEITTPDKYTIVFKFKPETKAEALYRFADYANIIAKEVVDKYGDAKKWENQVGTGPFLLVDYVPGSQVTFLRNPTHWRTNPIGPGKGDQLPYLDQLQLLIIPDVSTREASFRTGKIDMYQTDWEAFPGFTKSQPGLKWVKLVSASGGAPLSINMQNQLFQDIRVRKALMMAIDWQSLIKDYYGGDAQIITWPIMYNSQYAAMYLGLNDKDTPEAVKELYKYNPEQAKQLLKDAGYPSGFKTTLETNSVASNVDFASLIKDVWSKVGVQLEIKSYESGVWNKRMQQLLWQDLALSSLGGVAAQLTAMTAMYGPSWVNQPRVDDPVIAKAYDEVRYALAYKTQSEGMRLYRELMKHVLAQAYTIPRPAPPAYQMWWPWVKNYHGEQQVGTWNYRTWTTYLWVDQALKRSMGY